MDTQQAAVVLSAGILDTANAKTAHGLIRKSSRFRIVGVIDKKFAGKDAGEVIDGKRRDIPVYTDIAAYLASGAPRAAFAVVGVATPGGRIPPALAEEIRQAMQGGMSIVSGLHEYLSDMPEFRDLAEKLGVQLLDIRKPRPKSQLKFWTGAIQEVTCPVIGVLGTDCALGKRTTATMLTKSLQDHGLQAEMIFTGQTGWLQGYKYGFILDSTYNDFISGELENAVVTCFRELDPDLIIMEGQSALFNPSGPCGAEYLLSAGCKGVVLQHAPGRVYYHGHEHTGIKISLKRELDGMRLYGAEVIAITLNTEGLSREQAEEHRRSIEADYGIPTILPLEQGVDRLTSLVLSYRERFRVASPAK